MGFDPVIPKRELFGLTNHTHHIIAYVRANKTSASITDGIETGKFLILSSIIPKTRTYVFPFNPPRLVVVKAALNNKRLANCGPVYPGPCNLNY